MKLLSDYGTMMSGSSQYRALPVIQFKDKKKKCCKKFKKGKRCKKCPGRKHSD